MTTLIINLSMCDPIVKESWREPHTIRWSTKAEFQKKIAKLRALYPRWTGEVPRG